MLDPWAQQKAPPSLAREWGSLADLRYLRVRVPRGFKMPDEAVRTTREQPFSPSPAAPPAELLPGPVLTREFNTLDAQREAVEAFIPSQKHESWVAMPDFYDDGGFTGGTLARPAMQRLLADVEARKIDCIVVYKVDRLSRNLLDFARVMEGARSPRLLVRVGHPAVQHDPLDGAADLEHPALLSAVRARVHFGAHQRQDERRLAPWGKWVGGRMLLGYDLGPEKGKLVINKEEAKQVRRIFRLFIENGSVLATARELNRRGWSRKSWVSKRGKACGGRPWDKANLRIMLTNPAYIGLVAYKGETFPGEHEAIVERELWDSAQTLLARNRCECGATVRNKHGALLRGLLWCGSCGVAMHHH